MARHLENEEIARITEMYRAGVSVKQIAARFCIKPQTVSGIIDPVKRYGEQWYNWFCSEWDTARHLVSSGKYGRMQKESHGTQ